MFSKRDLLIFFAGVEAFHAWSHLLFYFSGLLPLHIFFITLTPQLTLLAALFNGAVSVGLLMWAAKIK